VQLSEAHDRLYGPYSEIIYMTWNLWIMSSLLCSLVIQSCIIWLAWDSCSLLLYSFLPLISCDLQENRKLKEMQYRFKCPHKGSNTLFTTVYKMGYLSMHASSHTQFCPEIVPKNNFQLHSQNRCGKYISVLSCPTVCMKQLNSHWT
jgi:hypothetical protein